MNEIVRQISHRVMLYASQRAAPCLMNQYSIEDIIREELKPMFHENARMRNVLKIARDGIRKDLERNGSMSDPIRTALVAIDDILSNKQISNSAANAKTSEDANE